MEKYLVKGGVPLRGGVSVSGAKNAALAVLPAALLSGDICRIENVPKVEDIHVLLKAIEYLGVKLDYEDDGHTVIMDCRKIDRVVVDCDYIDKIRASYYLLGALLGARNYSKVGMPGGCSIGSRPIDQHIKGFRALGASVEISHGMVEVQTDNLVGAKIYLDSPSVGATINIMMAACRAEGMTYIENPAKEPHIVDVANFLNSMGANIKGAGTDVIKIEGVKEMHGSEYMIIPDMIEAGTYMVAGAITKGDVLVKNLIPKHMEAVVAKLREVGAYVEEFDDSIRVAYKEEYKPAKVKTLPYPGFPTDMQPQFVALMSIIGGVSTMTESIFENRFSYTDELARMSADIKVEGNTAIVNGVSKLTGAQVKAHDLRAGAALVLAGLSAEGETIISDIRNIDRGYEHLEDKIAALGGSIKRIDTDSPELTVVSA